jgi:hypothetical protein
MPAAGAPRDRVAGFVYLGLALLSAVLGVVGNALWFLVAFLWALVAFVFFRRAARASRLER